MDVTADPNGGAGCNAGGFDFDCRFCGFANYVSCPSTQSELVVTVVLTAPSCPTICDDAGHTCARDDACTNATGALAATTGCNAGGYGLACRFCGFGAHDACPAENHVAVRADLVPLGLTTFVEAVEDLVEQTDANRTETTVVSRRTTAALGGDAAVLRMLLARCG